MLVPMEDPIEKAAAENGAGDPQAAYATLRGVLRYPGPDEEHFVRAVEVFADISAVLGAPKFRDLAMAIAKRPKAGPSLYALGTGMLDQGQPGVAATFLARVNKMGPGNLSVVMPLVGCFAQMGNYRESVDLLKESGLAEEDIGAATALALHLVMVGELKESTRLVESLRSPELDEESRDWLNSISAMHLRAAAIGEERTTGDHTLTAWHAVLNGGILLHESPFGYDDGAMNGRYAFVQDEPALMNEGITRVAEALKLTERKVKSIVPFPDRASQILAIAASEMLELPLKQWPAWGTPKDALVVAWSLDAISDSPDDAKRMETMARHARGQLLWSHACNWTAPLGFTPDLSTFLYQEVTHPWTGGAFDSDPDTGETTTREPDPRSNAILAKEIVNAKIEHPSAADPMLLERLIGALHSIPEGIQLGARRDRGERLMQQLGSPVPSARFF